MTDICLLAMPYAAVERPSLALGILKRSLTDQRLSTRVHYANLLFAERIGLANYFFLSNSAPQRLMGEWTFAGAAFDDLQAVPLDHGPYLRECQARGVGAELLWKIRRQASGFIEEIAARILADDPRIVGCSSAFQQHCASLALLKRIKALRPDVITLMGGSNCDGSMGRATHAGFPWVDYVVSGEADLFLPELCRAILRHGSGIPAEDLPDGVYGPDLRIHARSGPPAPRAVVQNLDSVPVPLYDDYFAALGASPLAEHIKPTLLFEASRGCWWGQTNQCTFCGLDSDGMVYRTKSADRVLAELATLRQEYGLNKFMATDLILSRSSFETLLPRLADDPERGIVFFETSANLTHAQVELLAAAGVRRIQPGLESLHDGILVLLKKGTCAWKNVQLLKWCQQHGISVTWNWLAGVPGEALEWYHEMLAWLPLIAHLQPPSALSLVRFDRFSPFQVDPRQYQLELEPSRAYAHVYPLPPEQLRDLANYFDDVAVHPEPVHRPGTDILASLSDAIHSWQKRFYVSRPDIIKREVSTSRPLLNMREEGGRVLISDSRPCAVSAEIVLEGLAAQVYAACDAALTAGMLVRHVEHQHGRKPSRDELAPIVERLLAQKVLLRLRDRFLSLAVAEPRAELLAAEDDPEGLVLLPRKRAAETLAEAAAAAD